MNAYINEVKLDTCSYQAVNMRTQVTEHPIEDKELSDITSHVDNNSLEFAISATLSGSDREQRYQSLLDMRDAGEIIFFNYFRNYDEVIITNISLSINNTNVIELQISFKQIEYSTVQISIEPLDSLKLDLSEDHDIGLQGTYENEDIQSGGLEYENN